jgi:hypothetical protein
MPAIHPPAPAAIEHFPAKWTPASRMEMLYTNNLRVFSPQKPVPTFAEYAQSQKHRICALPEIYC